MDAEIRIIKRKERTAGTDVLLGATQRQHRGSERSCSARLFFILFYLRLRGIA